LTKIGEKIKKSLKNYFQNANMVDYNPFAKTFAQSRKNLKWPELDAILEDITKNNFSKILDIGCGS